MLGPELDALWATLRDPQILWHRTSPASLTEILTAGGIIPNAGQFEPTYGQSRNSYAWKLPAVALFDFCEAEDEANVQFAGTWQSFLFGKLPGVIVGITGERLAADNVLRPQDIRKRDARLGALRDAQGLTIIPGVEALYVDTIPVEAFSKHILVGAVDEGGYRWRGFECGPEGLAELIELNQRWQAELDACKAARHAKGQKTFAEMVEEMHKDREWAGPV